MTRLSIRVATMAALALVAACAGHKGTTAARAPLRDGIYEFSDRPPQTSQTIEGRMTVLADTVMVDLRSDICRYDDRASSRANPFVYRCNNSTLYFDRQDPVRKASYTTTRTVTERRQVCDEYKTNAQGQNVCVRYRTETTEREIPVSGPLHPVRVADPTG